jgi:hypothetical protein
MLSISSTLLQWNYTHLGDITDYIVEDSGEKINNLYTFRIRVKYNTEDVAEMRVIQLNYNPTIIAGDMFKCYFGIFTMGYHIISIDGIKYLITKYENNIALVSSVPGSNAPLIPPGTEPGSDAYTKLGPVFTEELRRAYAGQWLIGCGMFRPTDIIIREHPVIGLYPTVHIDKYNKNRRINERFVKTIFGGMENFYSEVCKLLPNKNINEIILDLREILHDYSPDDMKWRNDIIERIKLGMSNL